MNRQKHIEISLVFEILSQILFRLTYSLQRDILNIKYIKEKNFLFMSQLQILICKTCI